MSTEHPSEPPGSDGSLHYEEQHEDWAALGRFLHQTEFDRLDFPIPLEDLGKGQRTAKHVVEDLLPEGQIVTLVGEEGDGKSTLAWQIASEATSGGQVCDYFAVPAPVRRVLIVDVEQSEEDAAIIRDHLVAWGLDVSGVSWLSAQGKAFDNQEDSKWLASCIEWERPDLLILDTGTEAVSKPRDDESVKPLFNFLLEAMRHGGVRSVLMLAQPRKRLASAPGDERQFDDLFGSRVWKGRSSAVLHLGPGRLTVWKQRGEYLKKRWGKSTGERYVAGQFVRTEQGPSVVRPPKSEASRYERIISFVETRPGQYSKSSLVQDGLGMDRRTAAAKQATADVRRLVDSGELRAVGQYHRLEVTRTSTRTGGAAAES